jgi:hypothetical protein
MYEKNPLTEVAPSCRLCMDEMPPLGQDVWLISRYGNGFRGAYHPELEVVAWAPIPKLTKEQQQRLRDAGLYI